MNKKAAFYQKLALRGLMEGFKGTLTKQAFEGSYTDFNPASNPIAAALLAAAGAGGLGYLAGNRNAASPEESPVDEGQSEIPPELAMQLMQQQQQYDPYSQFYGGGY